ncbi:MAG: amidophosphoribosyltransferase [Lentisphaeria bacterium]|jgi:amidophosphoribosyltransferase
MTLSPQSTMQSENPREYCGLCGVSGTGTALDLTYVGIHSLQHRGQEAAGIIAVFDNRCHLWKAPGLVDEVFGQLPAHWRTAAISHTISHVRYSTAGASTAVNAQPLMANVNGELVGIAHNGTISNAEALRRELQSDGVIFQTSTDTELVLHLAARALKRCGNRFQDALVEALGRLRGAYSLLIITRDRLFAVRDPHGFRPLSIGAFPNGGIMVASETIAFDVSGAAYRREVEPGELVAWDPEGREQSLRFASRDRKAYCIFEHVYFARPGSRVFGDSVYETRKEFGRQLAREAPVAADVIMPVPDSGMYAALGFAEESGLTFDLGLSRNHYVGRTFIDPGLTSRRILVQRKMQPIPEAIRGRRICLIEDSIVRGSTSLARIQTLRDAGAREVHMRVTCPPHRFGCYFGIDFPDRDKLIANKIALASLAKHLKLDSLAYLSQEGMLRCVKAHPASDYCCACFDGHYPAGALP